MNDAIGRPWAEGISSLLGPVVVENIGGGGSRTGVSSVAKAQPEGYTILVGNTGNFVIAPIASGRLPYDPLRDFDPIYRLATAGLTFVVHPSLPVTTLRDLVEYSKKNPGKLSYASAGTGRVNHLLGEIFKLQTMTRDIVHVPYRGAGPALNDLVGEQVPIMVAAVSGQLFELHHAGKVRIIATTTPNRLPRAPEVQTVAESGYPALEWESFIGLFAPKGTPYPIVEKVAQASRTAIEGSDLQRLWILAGMQPDSDSSPEKMRSFLERELSRLRPIISALGFTID